MMFELRRAEKLFASKIMITHVINFARMPQCTVYHVITDTDTCVRAESRVEESYEMRQ